MHVSTDGSVGGITVIETPDATVVRLHGEIDEALRQQASRSLERALDRQRAVVLDVARVRFIDSTGIAFLVQFCRIGREEGLDVTLLEPPPVVADVLEMLGLAHLFDPPGDVPPSTLAADGQASSAPYRDREVGGDPPLVLS